MFNITDPLDQVALNYNFEWMMYGSLLMLANIGNLVAFLVLFVIICFNTLVLYYFYYKWFPYKK
jgi:hypothetical protein